MKTVTINEAAAAQAIEFVVGPQARMFIENLYTKLDEFERRGWAEGYEAGVKVGKVVEQAEADAVAQYEAEEDAGWYEGDSGDETDYDPYEDYEDHPYVDALPPMQEQRSALK